MAALPPQFIIGGDDPSAYSLIFSPEIGNRPIGGVPEPSTGMLLIGFTGLGLAGGGAARAASLFQAEARARRAGERRTSVLAKRP